MRRSRRMDGRSGLNMAARSSMRRVLRKFFIVTICRKRYVPNRRVGSYQEVGTYRSTFAVISLWGKFGGLHACADTFPYTVPPPNFVITLLFSKTRLKRKDFQEIVRLTWAQEVSGSNPDAPTTNSLKQLRFFLRCLSTSFELGNIWEQLVFEQVHSIPLRTCTGMRVDLQCRCHVRVPELSLRTFQRRSLGVQQSAVRVTKRVPIGRHSAAHGMFSTEGFCRWASAVMRTVFGRSPQA